MGDPEEGPDYAERISANADINKNAWQNVLDDMDTLKEELEEDGWDVTTIQAGHTAPEPKGVGDHPDRFGLTFVIPGNKEEEFKEKFEDGGYPKYDVFRTKVSSRIFLLVEYLDPDSKNAILIAGNYVIRNAAALASNVRDEGVIYTHIQKLDKTHLGSFKHEDYEKFIPDTELIESYKRDPDFSVEEEEDTESE